jgi:hypothetical protein
MNLVIGCATNYQIDQIRNFILSLRKFYSGRILLVYNKNSFSEDVNFFLFQNKVDVLVSSYIDPKNVPQKRFEVYLKVLKKFKDIKKLLITDVRDVYFQADPFKNKIFSKLNFFMEDEKIKNCLDNSKWILKCFGKKELISLENQFISCSGITMGYRKYMLKYLKEMVFLIKEKPYFTLGLYSKGWDQGPHNFLVHSKKFRFAKKYKNQEGFVATLAHSSLKNFIFKKFFYSSKNKKFDIVHQYDRYNRKVKIFDKILKNII